MVDSFTLAKKKLYTLLHTKDYMNERIKELIAECTRVENGVMQVRRNETVYHFDKVKFAELIVRECAKIIEAQDVDPAFKNRLSWAMKDKFGVEE